MESIKFIEFRAFRMAVPPIQQNICTRDPACAELLSAEIAHLNVFQAGLCACLCLSLERALPGPRAATVGGGAGMPHLSPRVAEVH